MSKTMSRLWLRWAPLLALTAVLAACGAAAVAPQPTAPPAANGGAGAGGGAGPEPETPARQATCDDSAIRLLNRAAGVHGAIVDDTLHLGGATAPATCTDPTNESLRAGLPLADGRTAQVQQSEYYLIVIRYTSGNRLYVISRRGDGTSCVVDTNDECVAEVTDLPDDFDLGDLPDDVERTIPAGRAAAPTPSPSPGGDATPPGATPPAGGDDPAPGATPPAGASPPPAAATGPPGRPSDPQPRDGATGVTVDAPLLSWAAASGADHYYVHWYTQKTDRAGVRTTSTFLRASAPESHRVVRGETTRLAGETTYYWRVQAVTAGTVGCPTDPPDACTSSKFWSFTTGPAPLAETPPEPTGVPGAASNPQPRDGATGVRIDAPLLGWSAAPGALSYDVHWAATASAITSGQTTPVNTTSTAVRMAGRRAAETTYYWRVDAKNEAGTTAGAVWSFTTGQLGPGDRVAGPLAAPAWSAAARRLKIEAVALSTTAALNPTRRGDQWKVTLATLDPPSGNPIPTVTVTATGWPQWVLYFDTDSLTFYRRWLDRGHARSGTMTLTASNSEGTATLEVPYKITCPTMAALFERVRGTWDSRTNAGDFRRVVINDSGVTATRVNGTEIGPLGFDSFTRPSYALRSSGELVCHWLDSGSLHLNFSNDRGPAAPRCDRYIHASDLETPDESTLYTFWPPGCD